jgi:hypothetical protein
MKIQVITTSKLLIFTVSAGYLSSETCFLPFISHCKGFALKICFFQHGNQTITYKVGSVGAVPLLAEEEEMECVSGDFIYLGVTCGGSYWALNVSRPP